MTTSIIKVVAPHDLGTQFVFDAESGKWKSVNVSTDAANILTTGSDNNAYLSQTAIRNNQVTYTLGYNGTTKRIELKDDSGATISSVDPVLFEANLNGTFTNGIFTISDADGGTTATLDTTIFLQQIAKVSNNALTVSGLGTVADPLAVTLNVDADTKNILSVSATGVMVSSDSVLSILNAATFTLTSTGNQLSLDLGNRNQTANIINSLGITRTVDGLVSTVNGQNSAALSLVEMQDSTGTTIGYLLA